VKRGKERGRVIGKAAGDERELMVDEAGSDVMPDAAGGEGVTELLDRIV